MVNFEFINFQLLCFSVSIRFDIGFGIVGKFVFPNYFFSLLILRTIVRHWKLWLQINEIKVNNIEYLILIRQQIKILTWNYLYVSRSTTISVKNNDFFFFFFLFLILKIQFPIVVSCRVCCWCNVRHKLGCPSNRTKFLYDIDFFEKNKFIEKIFIVVVE